MYANRKFPNGRRGRVLTKEARAYKQGVALLIRSLTKQATFGNANVRVSIIDHPANHRGDKDNGLKIAFDCLQLSGIIENDRQIKSYSLTDGEVKKIPVWIITIEPLGQKHDRQ